jgi:hypothetical protein
LLIGLHRRIENFAAVAAFDRDLLNHLAALRARLAVRGGRRLDSQVVVAEAGRFGLGIENLFGGWRGNLDNAAARRASGPFTARIIRRIEHSPA